ncbi:MAG TPA: metal-dependent hydrolase [Methanoregulaceae archaeon]|nr:metal-dependent hydrolase [Sedimentisphaerales bacterium]HPD11445.1 metal-dependent hydrolase [Methanoregulaceae archaeon]
MTWVGHKISTFSGVYALTNKPLLAVGIALFSHLPDLVEFGIGKLVFRRHRGMSHSIWLWFAVGCGLYLLSYYPDVVLLGNYLKKIGYARWWLVIPVVGAMCHLLGDAMSNSGIPLWGGKRLALRLYITGTSREAFIVLLFVAAAVVTAMLRGGMKGLTTAIALR